MNKDKKDKFIKYKNRLEDILPSKMELMAIAVEATETLSKVGMIAFKNGINGFPHSRAIAVCNIINKITLDCNAIIEDFKDEFGEMEDIDIEDIIPVKSIKESMKKHLYDMSELGSVEIDEISGDS